MPQAPSHRAALKLSRFQPVLCSWIILSWVQILTLVLVELHNVLISPLFQLIQVFLQGGSPFPSIHFLRQFVTIAKFHQDTLDPIF